MDDRYLTPDSQPRSGISPICQSLFRESAFHALSISRSRVMALQDCMLTAVICLANKIPTAPHSTLRLASVLPVLPDLSDLVTWQDSSPYWGSKVDAAAAAAVVVVVVVVVHRPALVPVLVLDLDLVLDPDLAHS